MNDLDLFSALVGLTGAVGNKGQSPETDCVVLYALQSLSPDAPPADIASAVAAVSREKYRISPDCATCPAPCGNTSDYDLNLYYAASPELQTLKRSVLAAVHALSLRLADRAETAVPLVIWQAFSCLSYDLDPVTYQELIQELDTCAI